MGSGLEHVGGTTLAGKSVGETESLKWPCVEQVCAVWKASGIRGR